LDFENTSTGFYEAPQTFKSMGTENVFVATNDLHVSGVTHTTVVSGAGGLDMVATGGALGFYGQSGATIYEDGTEVIVIDSDRNVRFASTGGDITDPDVEIDGYIRADSSMGILSGNLEFSGSGGDSSVAKFDEGALVISSAAGAVSFVDENVVGSTWADTTNGVPLSSATSDWSTFQSLGFTSLLDALISGGTQDKVSGSIGAAGLASGNETGLSSADLSNVPAGERSARVDVFLNGTLMITGSDAEVAGGVADYRLSPDAINGDADVDIVFGQDLFPDDVVVLMVR